MLKTKTTVQEIPWNLNLRVRVGDTVTHVSNTWVNITGKNSEPGVGTDWEPLTVSGTISINGNTFTLRKHPSNTLTGVLEINDMIVSGWWGSTVFWVEALYLGGTTSDPNSWNIINFIEEIPLN